MKCDTARCLLHPRYVQGEWFWRGGAPQNTRTLGRDQITRPRRRNTRSIFMIMFELLACAHHLANPPPPSKQEAARIHNTARSTRDLEHDSSGVCSPYSPSRTV